MALSKEDQIAEERAQKIALRVAREFELLTQQLTNDIDFGRPLNIETLTLLNEYAMILNNSVYDAVFEDFLDLYGDRAGEVRAELSKVTKKDVAFTGADIDTMDAIINTDFEKVTNATAQLGTTVRQQVIRGIMLGQEAQIDTAELGGRLQSNVETEIRTGEMAFNRVVSNSKSLELGFDKFEYVGPNDKFNRPFCKAIVGKTFTLEEIQAMDNGQGLSVLEFGGGYNCRHRWGPRE